MYNFSIPASPERNAIAAQLLKLFTILGVVVAVTDYWHGNYLVSAVSAIIAVAAPFALYMAREARYSALPLKFCTWLLVGMYLMGTFTLLPHYQEKAVWACTFPFAYFYLAGIRAGLLLSLLSALLMPLSYWLYPVFSSASRITPYSLSQVILAFLLSILIAYKYEQIKEALLESRKRQHLHELREREEQQQRELSTHLQTVREEEKAHLAREIHDDLGSTLAALKLRLSLLLDFELPVEMKNTPLFERIESMMPILDNAAASMRRIITDLRPSILDNLGLMAAMEWQAREFNKLTGIECLVTCLHRESTGCADCKNCEYTLNKSISINLFRVFQESLTNVARHSGASKVEVELQPCEHEIVLSISDNGRGLPEGKTIAATSYGIRGMRERAEQLGGKIEFGKPPSGGFSVVIKLPQGAQV